MTRVLLIGALLASASAPVSAQNSACAAFEGALVISPDGTYLGKVTSSYDSDSIFNNYSTFGSSYSSKSVWNDYGPYGSEYSSKSARNSYASQPPILVKNRQLIGYLTTNDAKPGAVSPVLLGAVCYDYKPD